VVPVLKDIVYPPLSPAVNRGNLRRLDYKKPFCPGLSRLLRPELLPGSTLYIRGHSPVWLLFTMSWLRLCIRVNSTLHTYVDRLPKGKAKRTCIAPFVKLQLKALRYGSHSFAPTNYTIPASTLQTFTRWRHMNGRHLIQLATHLSTPKG